MNADRMISVFLAGVLVGGSVVYLAPNNSLAVGVPGRQREGGATGVSAGKSGASEQGGGGQADAGQGSEGQGGGSDAGGASSSGLGAASAGIAGAGPGTQGTQEMSPGVGGGGDASTGGVTGGGGVAGGETEASPISAQPATGAPRGATRLLRHLQLAPSLWKAQAEAALSSPDPKVKELAVRLAAHAVAVPTVTDRMPPNTEVVAYLVDSKLLLERMKLMGMDVGSLESQVDEVSHSRK
ncbi:MAG: hypothetical protein EXR71_14805 [Myxococcales bacterium]|nr:hypothetical protein [Myxococcales bacterium]